MTPRVAVVGGTIERRGRGSLVDRAGRRVLPLGWFASGALLTTRTDSGLGEQDGAFRCTPDIRNPWSGPLAVVPQRAALIAARGKPLVQRLRPRLLDAAEPCMAPMSHCHKSASPPTRCGRG